MVKSLCMRINLNKDDLAKVQNLLQTNENNIAVSDIFNEYLMEYEKDINKKTLNKYQGSEVERYCKALLYDEFNNKLRDKGIEVGTGIFGADMKVSLINDGPVTILLESNRDF